MRFSSAGIAFCAKVGDAVGTWYSGLTSPVVTTGRASVFGVVPGTAGEMGAVGSVVGCSNHAAFSITSLNSRSAESNVGCCFMVMTLPLSTSNVRIVDFFSANLAPLNSS